MPFILAIDDNESTLDLLRYIFERAKYQIACATNAFEGLNMALAGNPPDLAIIDIRLPQMDGFALIHEIKAHPLLEKMRIVILSSDITARTAQQAAEVGCDLLMEKPFLPQRLLEVVQQLL